MSLFPEGRRSLTAWVYQLGPGRFYQPAYRFIAADVGVERGSVLDVGTGPGWLAIHLAAGRPEVDAVGIDTSTTMLELAEANKGGRLNVTFRKMDATDIVYPEGTFEVAVAIQSAHHWTDPDGVFREVHRVLVPGGRFYVYEADPDGEIPSDWIARTGPFPTEGYLRRVWRKYGMDQAKWDGLRARAEASPFGPDIGDERHGFYRRLVCTR